MATNSDTLHDDSYYLNNIFSSTSSSTSIIPSTQNFAVSPKSPQHQYTKNESFDSSSSASSASQSAAATTTISSTISTITEKFYQFNDIIQTNRNRNSTIIFSTFTTALPSSSTATSTTSTTTITFNNYYDSSGISSSALVSSSSVADTAAASSSPASLLSSSASTILSTAYENITEKFDKNLIIDDDNWNWYELFFASLLCVLIVITVIGNTLVILSVMTTRRLRTVTNCFVMSLAVADWLVGIFVMPPAVAVHLTGSWQLGWILCDIWISLDVLLCTASILSLCAISIDRYLAVTQPLNYSRKRRSKKLALIMILIVWVLALAITCPPILGWYEPGRRDLTECRYNRNKGYVVFSAMGSFFIPMAVMIYVYVRISCVVATRHDNMTEIEVHKKHKSNYFDVEADLDLEIDPSSDIDLQANVNKIKIQNPVTRTSTTSSTTVGECKDLLSATSAKAPTVQQKNGGHYELIEAVHRTSSLKQKKSSTLINSSSNNSAQSADSSTNTISSINKCNSSNNNINQHHHHHHHHHHHNPNHCHHNTSHNLQHNYSFRHNNNNNVTYEKCTKHIRGHPKSLSNRILSLKRENKTTQTLSIVVGGFIVCWLPFFICYLITPFTPVSVTLTSFLTWLGWFNSAMNPFIYAFYSVDFRAAFWRLTLRRFFKNSPTAPYSSNAMSIKR